jgi:hypothetical protein
MSPQHALDAATAEGLTLVRANCATGFRGVHANHNGFTARVSKGGCRVSLGTSHLQRRQRWLTLVPNATQRHGGDGPAPALVSTEAVCEAEAEIGMVDAQVDMVTSTGAAGTMASLQAFEAAATGGLTLVRANNATGFRGVQTNHDRFRARQRVGGHTRHLGNFETAEEAALCYARQMGLDTTAEVAAAAGSEPVPPSAGVTVSTASLLPCTTRLTLFDGDARMDASVARSIEGVARMLTALHLASYVPSFHAHGYDDLEVLSHLDATQLAEGTRRGGQTIYVRAQIEYKMICCNALSSFVHAHSHHSCLGYVAVAVGSRRSCADEARPQGEVRVLLAQVAQRWRGAPVKPALGAAVSDRIARARHV